MFEISFFITLFLFWLHKTFHADSLTALPQTIKLLVCKFQLSKIVSSSYVTLAGIHVIYFIFLYI